MWALYLLGGLIVLFGLSCWAVSWLGAAEKFVVAPKTVQHDEHEDGLTL